MKPGRAFSLLTGVALLGAIAWFNEMPLDAQTSLLGAAAETARTAARSLLSNAVAAYNGMASKTDGAAPQPSIRVAAAPRAAQAPDAEPPSGNPLWALPLKQLSTTRDRPIFSPSRRPPPPPTPAFVAAPVAVRQPVKPAEPEKPTVSLLGTIIGANADDRIGVFLDTSTQTVVRLRVGEDHQGWVVRLIKAREATVVKSGEPAVVLEMPTPGDAAFSAMTGSLPPGMAPSGVMPPPSALSGAIAAGVPGAPAAQQRQPRRPR